MGDIVLTSPVLRCLRKQLPDAEIHFLTKEPFAPLVSGNPNIDRVHFLKGSLGSTIAALRKEGYDFVVDLHHNYRTFRIRHALHCRSGVYPKEDLRRRLMTIFKGLKPRYPHVVDRYFKAVEKLGVANDGQGLDYFPIPENMADIQPQEPYAVVSCGAQYGTKRIPLRKVFYFCCQIHDYPVVLLGDNADRKRYKSSNAKFHKNVKNLCGKTSINQSALLVKNAAFVLTPDTGLMHIASAFNRPTAVMWGSSVPQFGFAPYKNTSAFSSQVNAGCRPCSRLGRDRCPLGHFRCMEEHDWWRIAGIANNKLKQQESNS